MSGASDFRAKALDAIDLGLLVVDERRRVALWNAWMIRHSGVPRSLALGADIVRVFPGLADTRLLGAIEDTIRTGLSAVLSQQVNGTLFPLLHADGGIGRPMLQTVIVRPFTLDDGGRGCLIQVSDQTAALERERKLRAQRDARHLALVEAAKDAFVTVDEDGLIEWINPAAARMFGWPQAEIAGRPLDVIVPCAHERPLDTGLVAATALTRDGVTLEVEMSGAPWGSDGRRFVTLSVRDVTDRNRLHARMAESQRMQAIGQIAGGVAHEFNNLLTVLVATLDAYEGEALDREGLDAMRSATRRGAELTRALLAAGRVQPLTPHLLHVEPVLAEAVLLAAPSLGRNVTCTIDDTAPGAVVDVDRGGFQNAVLNLLLNARDAMPGGGSITLSISYDGRPCRELADGTYCRVTVADTGVGMPPEILARACEPFFTTKPTGQGPGLGLSMVAGFIRQSGGHLELSSVPGRGTRAALWLPAARLNVSGTAAGADDMPAAVPRRILLVDGLEMRGQLRAILAAAGHTVVEAADGLGALRTLDADPSIDVLLAATRLPGGMSGLVMAQEALSSRRDLHVLMMCGQDGLDPGSVADLLPGALLLMKPFVSRDLLDAVRACGAPGA